MKKMCRKRSHEEAEGGRERSHWEELKRKRSNVEVEGGRKRSQ
jgi:hypothetical protein